MNKLELMKTANEASDKVTKNKLFQEAYFHEQVRTYENCK